MRADAGSDVPIGRIVQLVLLDRDSRHYQLRVDVERVERLGVRVVSLELVTAAHQPHADPVRLTETLLSLT